MSAVKGWDDLSEIENKPALAKSNVDGNNLMLVDSNNLAYRWLKSRVHNTFDNDYSRTIESLGKSYSASRIICCFDFGRSYFRMEMHPEYKQNRKKPEDEAEQKHYDEFFECLNRITETIEYENYKFRGIEADDLITYFTQNLVSKFDHIWIVSSDRDLYQLISDKISIFNIFGRKEITPASLFEEHQLTPEEYLLSRIISGDKSDGINGIEGIGPVRSQSLIKEYKDLDGLIKALPIKKSSMYIKNLNAGKDVLIRNEKLMGLKKYNKDAIIAGKEGQQTWEELERVIVTS